MPVFNGLHCVKLLISRFCFVTKCLAVFNNIRKHIASWLLLRQLQLYNCPLLLQLVLAYDMYHLIAARYSYQQWIMYMKMLLNDGTAPPLFNLQRVAMYVELCNDVKIDYTVLYKYTKESTRLLLFLLGSRKSKNYEVH
jgi:hypothetical protein